MHSKPTDNLSTNPDIAPPSLPNGDLFKLGLLFGTLYFIQGIGEPTEGLIAQPTRSMLKSWGRSTGEIAAFSAWLGVPWTIKPLYGLLTDFLPWAGTRRRSYLIATSAATVIGLAYCYFARFTAADVPLLLFVLLVPTLGVAFSDVVADALMIEKGQPAGLTGRLQSIQWAAMYGATILAGSLGGWLTQNGRQSQAFLICALLTTVTLGLALTIREPRATVERGAFRRAARELVATVANARVWLVAAFLFLWSFNPFSTAVQNGYVTGVLGLSEQFSGDLVSLSAAASVVASLAYAWYGPRLSERWLVHLSIATGILATLTYAWMEDATSARTAAIVNGFFYMTGTIVQLDLAARVCPTATAGTTFALLMSVSNLGTSVSQYVGGALYDRWSTIWNAHTAFDGLVLVGAGCTAACWLLAPWLGTRGK